MARIGTGITLLIGAASGRQPGTSSTTRPAAGAGMARDQGLSRARQANETIRKSTTPPVRPGRGRLGQAAWLGQPASHEQLGDLGLVRKVESEIFRDAGAPKGQVSVNAENSVVFLRGEVEREWIEQLGSEAERVTGVAAVRNPAAPARHSRRRARRARRAQSLVAVVGDERHEPDRVVPLTLQAVALATHEHQPLRGPNRDHEAPAVGELLEQRGQDPCAVPAATLTAPLDWRLMDSRARRPRQAPLRTPASASATAAARDSDACRSIDTTRAASRAAPRGSRIHCRSRHGLVVTQPRAAATCARPRRRCEIVCPAPIGGDVFSQASRRSSGGTCASRGTAAIAAQHALVGCGREKLADEPALSATSTCVPRQRDVRRHWISAAAKA